MTLIVKFIDIKNAFWLIMGGWLIAFVFRS